MELERRIAEANKHAAPSTLDLLALVDPAKDAVSGSWKTNEEGLVGGPGDLTRIELPYEPPEEYDFRVTFVAHFRRLDRHPDLPIRRRRIFLGGSVP